MILLELFCVIIYLDYRGAAERSALGAHLPPQVLSELE